MRQVNDKIQESKSLLNCMFPIFPKNSLNVVSVKNVMQSTTAPKPMHAPNRVESISLRACFIVAWYGVLTRFVCTNIKEYKELYGITLYFCLASCRLHQLKCHHSLGNARKTCGTHDAPQQLPVRLFLLCHFSALHQCGFIRDVSFGTEVVYFRTHRQGGFPASSSMLMSTARP